MKVFLCGEEKAAFPIRAEDAEAALKTEYIQLVPQGRDLEGRQARAFGDCFRLCVRVLVLGIAYSCLRYQGPWLDAPRYVRC